jgi:methionine synthase II (cobalamin-independent)
MISEMLNKHAAFEIDPDEPPFVMKLWNGEIHRALKRLRFRPAVEPKEVVFATGYAVMAMESFATFDRLQRSGVIPAGVKFMIAIPSPLAPTYNYISKRWRSTFLEIFTAHLCAEVASIAAILPNDRIAIQWDVLQEILVWENYFADRDADYLDQIRSTLGKIGNSVPTGIELGYHLCYGSPKDQHLVQPRDTAVMVTIVGKILEDVRRPIQFFHLPVPKERTDPDFFKPLATLSLPGDTELYLGLVHLNDPDGNRARIAAARKFIKITGIGTECGWGRGDPDRVRALLDAHRALIA